MAFSQLGYQYIRPLYPTDGQGSSGGGGGGGGGGSGSSRTGAELSPAGSLCGGTQYELKDSPGVQGPAFPPPHPAFYPYGQYQFGDPSRPKNATRESTSTLKAWLSEHRKNPYPTKGEKIMLAIITKMTLTQVSTWFANARRRLKKENKMTWAPRSRSEDEEGTADGSEDGETDKRDPDDEEIDLENSDGEPCEGGAATAGAGAGAQAGQLLLHVGEDERADQEGGQPAAAGPLRLPSPLEPRGGSDTSEDEEEEEEEEEEDEAESSDGLEELAGAQQRFLKAVEARRRASTGPPGSPPPLRSPSPAPQPVQPAKPKIWSLAETATSPDNPSRKSPPGGGGGGGGAGGGSPPAGPPCLPLGPTPQPTPGAAAHRLVPSACPLGKFAGWSGRPFSAAPPHASHPLTLLNTPHLLGLAGGNANTAPAAAAAAAAAALAAFSRQADQAPSAEASGTDRSSALDVEKKLIKTAFQPVQRRPQNQLDAAMVLSALSSS
ncbi:hypothetical protein Chor_013439 [Crotalus horridus]